MARQPPSRTRSTLGKEAARARYVEMGELAALEQIREDARALDERALAVGPFARLDANAVAASDGKTRGAITNLFGSQASYQAETMALALRAGDWIEELVVSRPRGVPERGGVGRRAVRLRVGARARSTAATRPCATRPCGRCGSRPCRTASGASASRGPSMAEHAQWLARLEDVLGRAIEHFGLTLRDGVTLADLAPRRRA